MSYEIQKLSSAFELFAVDTLVACGSATEMARAFHDAFPKMIEALELGFKPSLYRSARLHKKLVKKALARGAVLIA